MSGSANCWWRLVNSDHELLGQILLPVDTSKELGERRSVTALFYERGSIEDFGIYREVNEEPSPVTVQRITLYRVGENAVRLVEGTIDLMERDNRLRFFPSYGLTQGHVKP